MSESSLSLTQGDILQAVGDYFGFTRNRYVWSREETAKVNRACRTGQNQFYNPPGHTFSFLRPRLELDIEADEADYDLPDDFGGFLDPFLSFCASDNQTYPVRITSVPEILRNRQLEPMSAAMDMLAAVSAKSSSGTNGQRMELLLSPTPASDGTLNATYYAIPNALSDTATYPLGGQPHAETLLASCLAAAEMEKTGQPGPQRQIYLERLQASIDFDRRTGPKHFGYNGDRSGSLPVSIYDLRSSSITRNGVPI